MRMHRLQAQIKEVQERGRGVKQNKKQTMYVFKKKNNGFTKREFSRLWSTP